jgi:hypothetical protein
MEKMEEKELAAAAAASMVSFKHQCSCRYAPQTYVAAVVVMAGCYSEGVLRSAAEKRKRKERKREISTMAFGQGRRGQADVPSPIGKS